MKDFENYTKTSGDYDQLRKSYGIDIILGKMSNLGRKKLNILDIGCGTGNYLHDLYQQCSTNTNYQNLISGFYGVEPNKGMLSEAKKKLPYLKDHLVHGSAVHLPEIFQDNMFDVVICTQVLHHLTRENKKTTKARYRNIELALYEMLRVVKPNGLICIDIVLPHQVNSFWFKHLIPKAKSIVRKKMPPFSVFKQVFQNKFHHFPIERIVSIDEILYDHQEYYRPTGPLDEYWRNTDSTWALASKEELQSAIQFVENQHKQNKMESWMKKKDKIREKIGMSTMIFVHV